MSTVNGATIKLQDITNIPIGKRKTCLSETVFFWIEILWKKQLGDLTEAAENYEWYTSSILLKDKKYKDHKLVLNLKQFNESNE